MKMKTVSYPKLLHVGDKHIADLFDGVVEITEKVDGSQIGFGIVNGELVVRSKGKEQELENPDKMFSDGVQYVRSIEDRLPADVFFYGEYLQKPRHSTLAYDRIPKNHIALFGARYEDGTLGSYTDLRRWALILDVETVPLIYQGPSTPEHMLKLVDGVSFLGGQQREGVVVKRFVDWELYGIVQHIMGGKYVTDSFKEVHRKDWAKLNTSKGGMEIIKGSIRTQARWNKAIQHLREAGNFTGTVKDIGNIVKEVQRDIVEEEKENLKDQLWKIYGTDITKYATTGLVDWYKEKIALGEFQDG